MLTLHIGLPKTATSFLQWNVFARSKGVLLLHRRHEEKKRRICQLLQRYVNEPDAKAAAVRRRLVTGLAEFAEEARADGRRLIVSNENVSVGAISFWTGEGPSPDRTAQRLKALAASLGPDLLPLRVVVGIRRQDQWLASRYAQSSKNFPESCQADFDRRIDAIAAAPVLEGPLSWLEFEHVRQVFTAAVGRENLFLLSLERLAADEAGVIADLGRFLGAEIASPSATPGKPKRRKKNQLSTGANTWLMKRDGGSLVLAPEREAALRERFAASNAALADSGALGLAATP